MKLNDVFEKLNAISPIALSDEYCERYGAYDNSGIILDAGKEIKSAVFSLDFSLAAVENAIAKKANLIVTHHPAIYQKIGDIKCGDTLGKKIVKCLENGISVVSMHLNLDVVDGGIDESMMHGIALASGAQFAANTSILEPVTRNDGYGRAYDINAISLETLVENMKDTFHTNRILFYGDRKKKVEHVVSFCGAGGDDRALAFALQTGADVLVSADFKHHVIAAAVENGLAVVALTHYAAENYGFEKYYKNIRSQLGISCDYHTDETLL